MKKYLFLVVGFLTGIVYVAACGTSVPDSVADAVATVVHAVDVIFDNTTTQIGATTVQGAIDEVEGRVNSLESSNVTASSLAGTWSFASIYDATETVSGSLTFNTDGTYSATSGFKINSLTDFCSSGRYTVAGSIIVFETNCDSSSPENSVVTGAFSGSSLYLSLHSSAAYVGTKA